LVAIQPNNVAYLKRRVEDFARETVANQRNRALRGEPHHAACRTRHHTRPRLTFPVWIRLGRRGRFRRTPLARRVTPR
jgi:hypothetical protein